MNIWQLIESYTKQSERETQKIQNIKHKWCQEYCKKVSFMIWLQDEIVSGKEHYLAWILLLRDETLEQRTKYLASHFLLFLWDALQTLRITWHFANYELLIRTLICIKDWSWKTWFHFQRKYSQHYDKKQTAQYWPLIRFGKERCTIMHVHLNMHLNSFLDALLSHTFNINTAHLDFGLKKL